LDEELLSKHFIVSSQETNILLRTDQVFSVNMTYMEAKLVI